MRVLLSWLRELCPTDLSAEDLAELLTPRGVKVESVSHPWEGLSGVTVARVLEVSGHPGSAKLCLSRVSDGSAERQLVVGVRNMRPGDLVPLALPGATLPGVPAALSARTIRGVLSEGMLCSPRELGISGEHTGILILPPDLRVGADLKQVLGLDDSLIDIEVKANRPDLLSVLGVAREAAAATGVPLISPDGSFQNGDDRAEGAATVAIQDLERCPRYLVRIVRGLSVGPSPVWVRARLTACGMRPISNVVDATNYVLLEMGQPLHAFDLSSLEGAGIVVRRAADGEPIVTLDGVARRLSADDLVIADQARAVAVAGVMGSADAEVFEGTRDVLLESAYFEKLGIRRTAGRLGLHTEASTRFGRGADPEAVDPASARAVRLMLEWSGGVAMAGRIDAGGPTPRRALGVRPARASLLLGHSVSADSVRSALDRLGFGLAGRLEDQGAAASGDAVVRILVPGHRPDLEREVDLIEEIARVDGYDAIGSELPGIRQAGGLPPGYDFRRRIRMALANAGLRETLSYSFASRADLDLMGHEEGVHVANPLSAEEAFLRRSLLPSLLRGLRWNLARGTTSVRLFEVGHVFEPADPVDEAEQVAFAMSGLASPASPWEDRRIDFFDAKGAIEALMDRLGIRGWGLEESEAAPLHPARCAAVIVGDVRAGVVGEIHPRIAAAMDLPEWTEVAELKVQALAKSGSESVTYRDVSRFPPVHRDLAFVVDEAVPAGALRDAMQSAAGELTAEVALFDVYQGSSVPEGRKSLAFSVDFRSSQRTLTDGEADGAVRVMVERLHGEFGADLRAG